MLHCSCCQMVSTWLVPAPNQSVSMVWLLCLLSTERPYGMWWGGGAKISGRFLLLWYPASLLPECAGLQSIVVWTCGGFGGRTRETSSPLERMWKASQEMVCGLEKWLKKLCTCAGCFWGMLCGLNRRVGASRVSLYFWRATSSSLKRNGPILVLRL